MLKAAWLALGLSLIGGAASADFYFPPSAASSATFTPPGQLAASFQSRGLNTVYVSDYGASGSGNTYTSTAAVLANATKVTTTGANDYVCNGNCPGLLIPLGGDTVSIAAPTMTAFRVDGPTVEANGNWTTASTTITMSAPGIAPAAATVVYDITAGCQVGTVSTWPTTSLTLTLQGTASCASITNNDFLAFNSSSQFGPTVGATSQPSLASPNITMSGTGPPTEVVTQFDAFIVGTTMTVKQDATLSGPLYVGMPITGAGVTANTSITGLGTGVNGAGTYTVNNSQTVGSSGSPVAMSGPVSSTIIIYDVTASAKLGTLKSWSGTALVMTGNSLSAGSGATDSLAFMDTFAYFAAAMDADHIDAKGGHSGGGVGTPTAAVNVSNPISGVAGCTNCVSVFLGAQNYVSLAITPSAVATATASGSFTGAANTQTQLSITLNATCPANAVFGEQVKDTTLAGSPIIGTVYSCVGTTLKLQEGSNAASFGAADALSFLAPATNLWRSIGAGTADYFINSADILQFAGFSSTYNDTGFCSTGNCPSQQSQIPFNVSQSHTGAPSNDWAVRTVTSVAGNVVNFTPATVNSTGSAQTIYHDDTAAINLAVTSNATNGAVIRLTVGTGSGNYYTSSPIFVLGTNNIVFQCDGRATDIVATGTGDIFDFVGRKGSQVYGDGVKDCASYNFYRQSAGLAVYASYTNKFQLVNDLFDLGVSGVVENNMTNCVVQDLTLTNMQAEPEIGIILRGADSSYGQCNLIHNYVQGMTGQNWPNLAVDGVGMDIMGGVATMWGVNNQLERIPGSGIRLSDVNNTTNVPLGAKLNQASSEFQTSHAIDIEGSVKTFISDPAVRSGGYSNFISCAISSTIFDATSGQNGGGGGTGLLATNEELVISGGQNDGAAGDGVFLNGQQATLNGETIFSNSVVNQISGQSGVFGPGGTQGNCPGVELGFRSTSNVVVGNVIGGQLQPNAQAEPILIDAGATANTASCANNVCAGNVIKAVVDNSGGLNSQGSVNVVKFSPLAKASGTATPVCNTQACTPTGTGYGNTLTGTLTLTTNGGKFVCSTYPVLNVTTNAGGNVITVNNAGIATTQGSCTTIGATTDEVWTAAGGLSAGSNALFTIGWNAINQTYTPTIGVKEVDVAVMGGGGQGGGGANDTSGTISSGGGGGGAGATGYCSLTASAIGSSQTVTVGLGGRAGGAPGTAAPSAGSIGTAGANSAFGAAPLCRGNGGGAGFGGINSATAAGGGGGSGWTGGGNGGSASAGTAGQGGGTGGNGAAGTAGSIQGGGGGGGGGAADGSQKAGGPGFSGGGGGSGAGLTVTPAAAIGGAGGATFSQSVNTAGPAGGAIGTVGAAGVAGTGGVGADSCTGASGGGSNLTTLTAGNGGAGCFSSGGGGGGSVVSGAAGVAGFGGPGGDGEVYVIEKF